MVFWRLPYYNTRKAKREKEIIIKVTAGMPITLSLFR